MRNTRRIRKRKNRRIRAAASVRTAKSNASRAKGENGKK
jgi:hypothetical protein